MGEILSADELRELVMGFGPRAETVEIIIRSHEALRARLVEVEQALGDAKAEADDLYHRWTRQVRYLVGILAGWDEAESALCRAYMGAEPPAAEGSLIERTRTAIAMARGDLDPAVARAVLDKGEQTDG